METIKVRIIEPVVKTSITPAGPPGPPGGPGPPGPPGPPGATTGDLSFNFEQMIASTEWVIDHTLSKQPSVTTVDSEGRRIYGRVEYVSPTQIRVTFLVANAGHAYLN